MPDYSIVLDPGDTSLETVLDRIGAIEALLDQIVDTDILPALARNYEMSGLHEISGALKAAISERGAPGNIISKFPGGVTVGLDTDALPYAKWTIGGRGEVLPKTQRTFNPETGKYQGGVLHWKDPATGKDVFATRSGPVSPHSVYFLSTSDLDKIAADLMAALGEGL